MTYRAGREAAFSRATAALQALEAVGGVGALGGRSVDHATSDQALIEIAEWAEREARLLSSRQTPRADRRKALVGEALDRFMTLDRRVRPRHAELDAAAERAGVPAQALKPVRPKMSTDLAQQRAIARAIISECERVEALAARLGVSLSPSAKPASAPAPESPTAVTDATTDTFAGPAAPF